MEETGRIDKFPGLGGAQKSILWARSEHYEAKRSMPHAPPRPLRSRRNGLGNTALSRPLASSTPVSEKPLRNRMRRLEAVCAIAAISAPLLPGIAKSTISRSAKQGSDIKAVAGMLRAVFGLAVATGVVIGAGLWVRYLLLQFLPGMQFLPFFLRTTDYHKSRIVEAEPRVMVCRRAGASPAQQRNAR